MHLKNAKLLAVADTSQRSKNLAKALGVKEVYSSYEKLLQNPNVDCVVISLPTFLHAECAIKAAKYGKHILLEKPLARNVDEGRQIVHSAKLNHVKIMVGYPLRFSIVFNELKNKILNGLLGEIVTAHATNIGSGPFTARQHNARPSAVPSWWFDKTLTGGGALMDLGSHMINLLRWYFGNDVKSVKGLLYNRFNMDFEDKAICLIEFKDGPTAIVNVGWFSEESTVGIELFGTAGKAFVRGHPEKTLRRVINAIVNRPSQNLMSFYVELEHFINCIKHDLTPCPSAEDGLKDLEIISSAYQNQI